MMIFLANSLIIGVTRDAVLDELVVQSFLVPLRAALDNRQSKLIPVNMLSAEAHFLEACSCGCMTMDSHF